MFKVTLLMNAAILLKLNVMFVCLFRVVLCFSLEFSSSSSSTCCYCRRRCMYCEYDSIIK